MSIIAVIACSILLTLLAIDQIDSWLWRRRHREMSRLNELYLPLIAAEYEREWLR